MGVVRPEFMRTEEMHIAEVTTPQGTVLFHFDPDNRKEVADLEQTLGDMADDGMVQDLSFHPEQ